MPLWFAFKRRRRRRKYAITDQLDFLLTYRQ
uniref:Uncharacterized protein n=1 Tax=Rhizophora mucronata TaxID=61149 RepID=A0A2P2JYY7_RHIMU